MKRMILAALLAMCAVTTAYADEVKVSKAWARATAPGQDTGMVQLTITSKKDATLVGAASGSAQSVEIHNMIMEGDVMKMRQLDELPLPAKTAVSLGEDGNHLMLIGLRNPLVAGRKLPFALRVKMPDGKVVIVRALAEIKPLEMSNEEEHQHHHHH